MAAKMLRAYGYLREPDHSVETVSEKLGYESVRVFSRNTREVFGCCPSTLRKESNAEEVVRQLLEWYHKPANSSVSDINSLFRRLKSHRFGPGRGVRSSEELTS
jgi:AraC-like DNA-binding protein